MALRNVGGEGVRVECRMGGGGVSVHLIGKESGGCAHKCVCVGGGGTCGCVFIIVL